MTRNNTITMVANAMGRAIMRMSFWEVIFGTSGGGHSLAVTVVIDNGSVDILAIGVVTVTLIGSVVCKI